MIKPDDKMSLAIAVQDYEKQRANYHFYNWELAELNRCESEIKGIISRYETNMVDLIELCHDFPLINKFISPEKLNEMRSFAQSQTNNAQVFYSFDGQKFATLEEAAYRNEQLQNGLSSHKL